MRPHRPLALGPPLLGALVLLGLPQAFSGQAPSAYKYRDANGQWVFTDRSATMAAPGGDALSLNHSSEGLRIAVERIDTPTTVQLVASNGCLCAISVRAWIETSDFPDIRRGTGYQATLGPGERHTLVEAPRAANKPDLLRFNWQAALGAPGAVHSPPRPYRAPFALGATYDVVQAYPSHVTHVTPDSRYAIDFALPDETPVYAARAGTVINLRHDSFSGAPLPAMLDQANIVEVLHDDGTIAVYAHLHWDSIRVRVGQHVGVGEYIANSGNTGFTTGPHLHFAVWRNAGSTDVSVPVQFAGPGGVPVTPTTSVALTAY